MATIAPPSSPMMTVPPAETTREPALLTDDIPDPAVPAGTSDPAPVATPEDATWRAHEALLHGFCQAMQGQMSRLLTDEAIRLTKQVDETITRMMDYVKGRLEGNEHAEYSLAAALASGAGRRRDATQANATPYTAYVDARTPHGFPLRLTIEKATSGELIEELGGSRAGWLPMAIAWWRGQPLEQCRLNPLPPTLRRGQRPGLRPRDLRAVQRYLDGPDVYNPRLGRSHRYPRAQQRPWRC